MVPGKALFVYRKYNDIFSFFHKNICCGYSLEAPRGGASNEYTQHMFSWKNQKKRVYYVGSLSDVELRIKDTVTLNLGTS